MLIFGKARSRIRYPSPDTSPPPSGLLRADTLASAVGGGGEMGDDSAKGNPARPAINPPGKKSDKAASKSRRFFSLSSLRTDLDRVYLELGGPAPLRGRVDRRTFARCCDDFSWRKVEPTLRRFQKDRDIAKRHWPWVAFALSQYRFELKERLQNSDRLTPGEVISHINDNIRRPAKELASGLARLQSYSEALGDPTAPLEKSHLQYLDQLISQATAGDPAAEVNEDPTYRVWVFSEKMSFFKRLSGIEAVAGEAAKRVDRDLLKRKKGQADPALHNLVRRGAEIWSSLTGRRPSPNRVHRRDSGEEPDFVLFIQDLVLLAGGERPSRKAVEISLGNHRTPDAG